ncbi:acetylglutamate kinase [Clostridium sp.]|jgi:acetylglutamate kinase|uniref:acetylglutamate kinase n=1 Tax=Clostridium sp. TaxID=1506 RepID=UPI003EE8B797
MAIRDKVKADILIQALPYIQKHFGKTIVVKYGGNAMINESLKEMVINDLILLSCIGIKVVVVHGGGPQINKYLSKFGKKCEFINGLRVTDDETMEVVQMVLDGKVNKEIVALIDKNGGKAIGLSGIDAGLLKAKKKVSKDEVDLGYVGEVTSVDEMVLINCLNDGYIPVVSTVALGEDDYKAYNINADYAASKIAAKLKADKLILLTDVPGILRDFEDETSLITEVDVKDIHLLKKEGIIKGGMIPKIECCEQAIEGGVKRTHIIDGRVPHSILLEMFLDEGIGTMID